MCILIASYWFYSNDYCILGRDGTRAFVTGTFTEEGATDDITGLSGKEILSVEYWNNFYNSQYTYVGLYLKLVIQFVIFILCGEYIISSCRKAGRQVLRFQWETDCSSCCI